MKNPFRYLTAVITVIGFTISAYAGAPGIGKPNTSKHESFKPEDFARIAVIIKTIQANSGSVDPATGLPSGPIRLQPQAHGQSQLDRLVEQRFMRVLLGDGYTLVSRTDLDAAMKEKGLDEAKLTDDKLTQEAGKILHVSAIMVVSVDDYKTTTVQRPAPNQPNQNHGLVFGGQQMVTYYQVTASVSARLIKIDNNMVMWTADLTLNQAYSSPDLNGTILGLMSEAIADAFPPLVAKDTKAK